MDFRQSLALETTLQNGKQLSNRSLRRHKIFSIILIELLELNMEK